MFEVKKFSLENGRDLRAILTQKDANEIGLFPKDKIEVICSSNLNKRIICDLEIFECIKDCNVFLKRGEIGLYEEAYDKLKLSSKQRVKIIPAHSPHSLELIREKFRGKIKLTQKDFEEIIEEILENKYSDITKTFFVLACASHSLDDKETIGLTNAMVNVGKILEFKKEKNEIIFDKHCIGGVPNNRTSMIIIPILASLGIKIPKTSSRSITSPAGTADTMEVLANVEVGLSKMHDIVEKVGACLIWGGGVDLSPADDVIIEIEHPLEIDSEGQMIASILSKKKCAGATHVLLDIPIGKTAKVNSEEHAMHLKKRFERIGKAIGLEIKVIITDGSEPIGCGVGPVLEAKDVIKVLSCAKDAPEDLREKSLMMAGIILEIAKHAKVGKGRDLAETVIESGLAMKKFEEIRIAQGKKELPSQAKYVEKMLAKKEGKIKSIHNKLISRTAFLLGAPNDKVAGLRILKKVGDSVKINEPILELHSNSKLKLEYGISYVQRHLGIVKID